MKKVSGSLKEVLKEESFVDSSYLCLETETTVDLETDLRELNQFSSRSCSQVARLEVSRQILRNKILLASVEIVLPGVG